MTGSPGFLSPVRYGNLTPAAKETIKASGLSIAAYIRYWSAGTGMAPAWHGDACGCPDDRCRDGYHHDPHEECGCLPVCIREALGLPLVPERPYWPTTPGPEHDTADEGAP